MGEFGSKCSKSRITKDHGNDTATRNKFNIQQENNAIVNHAVDYIILEYSNKLSAEAKSNEKVDSEIDENYLYHIDNMSLYEKKKYRMA